MKVKVEIIYNNKLAQSSEIDYEDFSVDKITEKLKFPNFKPQLVALFHEDSHNKSCSILNLKYSNANKKTDLVTVRIIPLFAVMDLVMSRVA
jgi:hypothetical protein